ncbi:hypothetical protein [Streptomyces sp. NRRL B-24484]|uniref:hypothetical protein n=1 Tax=Streptomyces sp. NRRL B-24484 TaxID=1463833 RepID=UPI0004C03EE3|nr:hypothetical protein [Streptomyces sp. NRRL B-24484]
MAQATTPGEQLVSSELLIETCNAEAEYQAALKAAQAAKTKRDQNLYEMWRAAGGDARAVAATLPTTVKTRTVKAAVVKLAPPQDFTQLSLLDLQDLKSHALAA